MMRIGQVLLRGVAAMVELANDTAVKPRCDQQRARVAPRLASALARCGPHQAAQSTSGSPSIRLNSLTLWLTTVAPMARA